MEPSADQQHLPGRNIPAGVVVSWEAVEWYGVGLGRAHILIHRELKVGVRKWLIGQRKVPPFLSVRHEATLHHHGL